MLDRLISGAGAVTDAADRAVRLLVGGWRGGFAMTRPGSVVVAGLLLVLAGILVAAGLEVTAPTTPVPLDPAGVATARDLGDRTYSTMTGSLSTTWIETYDDANANGIEDGDETGDAWFYWLVDPVGRRGVTVRSERSPAEIFTYRGRGIVIADPKDRTEEYGLFDDEIARAGITVDPEVVLDTTIAVGEPVPVGPAGPFPASGTAVELSGARTGSYLAVCSVDSDRNGRCDADDQDRYEIVAFDPATRHGIRVLVRQPPAFSDATVTGLLRREERAVDDAQTSQGFDFTELGLQVSDRYLLDEVVPPGSAPLAYVLALGCLALAGTILVGLAGGYLIYRRSAAALPAPATTLGPGERLPVRITGILRTPTGREHVREVPGSSSGSSSGGRWRPWSTCTLRTGVSRRSTMARTRTSFRPHPRTSRRPRTSSRPSPRSSRRRRPPPTARSRRRSTSSGTAGRRAWRSASARSRRLSIGQAMAFRGARPALRILAGTGLVVLSFDTPGDRDRAAAELLAETGLGRHDIDPTPDTREEPDGRLGIH